MKKYLVRITLEQAVDCEDMSEALDIFLKSISLNPSLISKHEIDEIDEFGIKIKVEKGYRVK